ncbi:hypothetical protein Fcan01_16202 [Folsomia candida]|uniref:Uncharacterized protein n=1 Tax=Folsomia candida TaxID=158441 RepID=A0A226DUV2_FOLCA|nr:hypothetical protein Fcan01_16202 [Folsomia candida]
MLNGKVFKYFARVILFCGKAGSSPFVWDVKTGRLFVSRKLRNKTRSGISVQVGYSIYCVIKAILLTANVGSFYFSISLAYGITINSLLWIPLVVYEKDFAAFMNCSFRFVKEYQGNSLVAPASSYIVQAKPHITPAQSHIAPAQSQMAPA